jgi:hypothetical protein
VYYRKGTFRDIARGFNRVVINGSPQILILNSLAWIFIAASCGVVGLGARSTVAFVLALILLAWAALEIVLALVRASTWKKAGLSLTLPDGTALCRVDHIFERSYVPKVMPFRLPTTSDSQEVTVPCPVCQQQMVFRLVSQQKRQAQRLRGIVISVLCSLAGIGLAIVGALQANPQDLGGQLAGWGVLLGLFITFCSLIALGRAINYYGIRLIKAPISAGIRHRALLPDKTDLEQFRSQAAPAMGAPAQQNPAYYQR